MKNWDQVLEAQFHNSPRLMMILEGFNQAIDPNAVIDSWYDNVWNPKTATGYGLDVWGRIVGVNRVIQISTTKFFGFNQQIPGVTTYGYGVFYSGNSSTQNFSLSDEAFRRLIFAKAAVNISNNSITTLNAMLMMLFPTQGRAYVKDYGNMQMSYVFEWEMTPAEQSIAISSGVLPRPSGVAVNYEILPNGVNIWRPLYHVSPPDHWMNDVQRPLEINGRWYGWYLYNPTWPNPPADPQDGLTEWRQISSTDYASWQDDNLISIPRGGTHNPNQGDPWTGTAVIDTNNTAGFGAGAIVVIVTMAGNYAVDTGQKDSNGNEIYKAGQSNFLWYTTDITKPMTYWGEVYPNPYLVAGDAQIDFRDPCVFWDSDRSQWVACQAERFKIGYYTSKDLKNWQYAGYSQGTAINNVGTIECPHMVKMSNGTTTKWVILFGGSIGCTGTYYQIGEFDGKNFTPDHDVTPQRLDAGPDCYASAVWQDSNGNTFTYAWMNNWAWAEKLPTVGYEGNMTLTRQLALDTTGTMILCSPVSAQNEIFSTNVSGTTQNISDNIPYKMPTITSSAYRMDITLQQINNTWPTSVTIGVKEDATATTQIIVNPSAQSVTFRRANSGIRPIPDDLWSRDYTGFVTVTNQVVLSIFVDSSSVEIFGGDGKTALTGLIFPPQGANGISISCSGGAVSVQSLIIRGK